MTYLHLHRKIRDIGYIEGQNIAFEFRSASGKPAEFSQLATDLVRLKVDLIFARGPEAVQAGKNATQLSPIPIVAIDLESDPVADRLVASLANQAET